MFKEVITLYKLIFVNPATIAAGERLPRGKKYGSKDEPGTI